MARPERNDVDYFPFLCDEGKKMFYIEETYGNDGFAVFVKILRELAKTNFHYLNLSSNITLMFLSAKCKVSTEILESIILDLVKLGKFDSVLWNENKIIWCQDFIDSIQDAYIKRKNKCITYDSLLLLLIGLGVRKQGKGKIKDTVKPQSIVKYSKVKENIYREFKHLSLNKNEFDGLLKKYTKEQIDDILDRIENYKQNDKYVSLNLTAQSWLKKEYPEVKKEKIRRWRVAYSPYSGTEEQLQKAIKEFGEELKIIE